MDHFLIHSDFYAVCVCVLILVVVSLCVNLHTCPDSVTAVAWPAHHPRTRRAAAAAAAAALPVSRVVSRSGHCCDAVRLLGRG